MRKANVLVLALMGFRKISGSMGKIKWHPEDQKAGQETPGLSDFRASTPHVGCAHANRCMEWNINRHMALQSWRRAAASCRADVTGKVRTTAHLSLLGSSLLCPESSRHAWWQHVLLTDGRKRVRLGNLAEHQSRLFKSSPADQDGGEKLLWREGLFCLQFT